MAIFEYKAINKDTGEKVEGNIEAANESIAVKNIEQKNLSPFELKEQGSVEPEEKSSFTIGFNKGQNLILFTSQLANLLNAGIQLGEALKIIIRLLESGNFKEVVKEVYSSLKGGQNFAKALANHPRYFSSGYVSMIKAGEEGGFLDLTCQRLAKNLENRKELKSFIISSLIYPIVLFIVAILAVVVMITYVLPKFKRIYGNYGSGLPWSTEMLLKISYFLTHYWMVIIFGLGMIIVGLWSYYQTEVGKRKIDNLVLNLPLVGDLIMTIAVTKISRNIGSMLESGVSLLKTLRVSKHITNNIILQQALEDASLQVKRGGQLSAALDKTEVFPRIVVYMISVGEQTGNLASMLLQIADNFEADSRQSLDKLMKVFEPLLILVMGISIGFIVISMLLPILKINTISF